MPEFVSETEWLEALNKSPKDSPLYILLHMAEKFFDNMEKLGIENYNQALEQIPHIENLSAGDVAELFVLATQFWKQGERLAEELTILELKLIKENIAIKMSRLAQVAATEAPRLQG